jgi:hypothetical protein
MANEVRGKPKNKGGRPKKYDPSKNELVYKFCLLGATDAQIADMLGVDEATVNRWKVSEPEFCKSLKRGKEEADATVAQSLYQRAKGYVAPDIITATHQGQITDIKEVEKHYPPDTTAAIFWLKNRQPKQWRDKQELDISGALDINKKTTLIDRYLSDDET